MPLSDFELREKIGEGAFGVVYRARQPSLDRDVALKVAHRHADAGTFAERFLTEARLIARIEHANVVPLYDFGIDGESAYLVMRLMEGGSLADALERGPFRPTAAKQLLQQIAAGLAAAHRRGVVHADVKPSNVLFDRSGSAYLADFGIAVDLYQGDRGAQGGTPAYLAPETIRDGVVDERTDVYALGTLLAEVLTGDHPFGGGGAAEMVGAHLERAVPMPSGLPAALSNATSRSPEERPADADAFAAALDEWQPDAATDSHHIEHIGEPLPARYSSFNGRSGEVEEVRRRIAEHRLVTVTGVGGIGKSSVAIESTRGLGDSLDVTYVSIESVEAGAVAIAAARAMGSQPSSAPQAEEAVVRAASTTPSLLLLDGCEHVIAETAEFANRVLRASSELRLVATTREPLGIPGESIVALGPLAVGDESPAVDLFLDRAGMHSADPDQRAAAVRICDALDGIPLAIELAASRAGVLPLEAIEKRLDRQVDLLTQRHGSGGRHRSIAAALEWSYQLLPPSTQAALRTLATFRTAFAGDAASALLAVDDASEILADLLSASLLSRADEATRWRMLEPVRQYAQALAEESGEEETLSRRHADWATTLAHWIRDHRLTPDRQTAVDRARKEHAELVAAIRWSLDGDGAHAVDIIAAMGRVWAGTGIDDGLVHLMAQAVEHPDAEPSPELAIALSHLGWVRRRTNVSGAQALIERSVTMARALGDDAAIGMALAREAVYRGLIGDLENALDLTRTATVHLRRARHPDAESERYNAAMLLLMLGRIDDALQVVGELLELTESGDFDFSGDFDALYGALLCASGRREHGLQYWERGISAFERAGQLGHAAEAWRMFSRDLSLAGQHERALTALSRSRALQARIGDETSTAEWCLIEARSLAARSDTTAGRLMEKCVTFLAGIVAKGEQDRYHLIESNAGAPSGILLLAGPAALVLAKWGQGPTARAILDAAIPLMEDDVYRGWDPEPERLRAVLDRLPPSTLPPPADPLALFELVLESFGEGSPR